MKIIKTLLFVLGLSLSLSAQEEDYYFVYQDYDWEENQTAYTGEVDDSTSVVILKEKMIFHYHFEDERFVMDRLFHRRVYLNNTRALEQFNRKYVPTGEGSELLKFKARAINNGKITEIGEDDIQTGKVEDSDDEYNYFAFEGLEVGSEVEFYYVNRYQNPITDGLKIDYQEDEEILDFELDVISPWNLIFNGKVYNLPDSIQRDTTLEYEQRLYMSSAVPAYEEESVTPGEALRGRVIFKLDRNLANGAKGITSYNYTAQNVVAFLNRELERNEAKVIKKEAKEAQKHLMEEDPDLSLGLRVEHYIKDTYNYIEAGAPELRDLDFIQEYKVFNTVGALQLYSMLYNHLEVPYQVVYTCNRNSLFFDEDFEADNFLDEALIYLSDEDIYIDPVEAISRNGVTNFNYTGTKGLFIDRMMLGDEYVATAEVQEIPYQPAVYTSDTINAKVIFGEDLLDNKVEVYRALTGYSARTYQGIFPLIDDEDDKKEFEESLIKYIDEEGKVEDISLNNVGPTYLGRKPLQVTGKLSDFRFIESAANDVLLNVGKLIGPQMTMYDEDSVRQNDIYNLFAHSYYRTIEFDIPEGYRLADPEKMVLDEKLVIDGETKAVFKSSYTIEGSKVLVTIIEWYEDPKYPKEYFQEYLSVINAAADFNKVSVLLEKEG